MGTEYVAKVFKSGNSVALRLPKALGFKEGDVMRLHSEDGDLIARPVIADHQRIDLDHIYGSVPDICRPAFDESRRDWLSGSQGD